GASPPWVARRNHPYAPRIRAPPLLAQGHCNLLCFGHRDYRHVVCVPAARRRVLVSRLPVLAPRAGARRLRGAGPPALGPPALFHSDGPGSSWSSGSVNLVDRSGHLFRCPVGLVRNFRGASALGIFTALPGHRAGNRSYLFRLRGRPVSPRPAQLHGRDAPFWNYFHLPSTVDSGLQLLSI